MTQKKRFWTTAGLVFGIGLAYPIAVIFGQQPWEESRRWIQNDPGFTVFLMLVLPFAAGILAVKMDLRQLWRLSVGKRRLAGAVLAVLLTLGAMVATVDLREQLSSPIRYRNSAPVLVHETGLRAQVRNVVDAVRAAATDEELAARRQELATTIRSAREEYRAEWPPIDSLSALGEVGSPAAQVAFALNVFAALFAAVLFWYCWLLVQFRSEWKGTSFDWLLLTVGLMLGWFPLRLYSEWYLHFFSLQGMADYPAFQFLVVVAVIAYCVVAFRVTERVSIRIFAAAGTALIGLVTTLGKFAPEWVEGVAWALEGWDFRLYVTLLLLIVLALSSMIWSLVDESIKPAVATSPKKPVRVRRARAGG